jgi:hypothetical protein
MTATSIPLSVVALRILAIVGGGYLASAGLVAVASAALPTLGWTARADAVVLSGSLGFLVYLVLVLWIAAERRLWLAFLVPLALAGAGFCLAQLLAPAVVVS